MPGLETLTPATRAEALAYLARRPYENVYVSWLIASGQHSRGFILLWRDVTGAVAGVCYYGAQIVPIGPTPEAIDAFAERSRSVRGTRMIVGVRPDVERFWKQGRRWFAKPVAMRANQPVYAIDRTRLHVFAADPSGEAARATASELDELVPHSARMMAGEIGGDPDRIAPEFRARCARIIAEGWWWRYRVDGRLAFTCTIGSASDATAQIQGVWTPPELRGAGHATRGLAAICKDMLETYPTLSLYVNDFNKPAIALYERVGFTRVAAFATVLFD